MLSFLEAFLFRPVRLLSIPRDRCCRCTRDLLLHYTIATFCECAQSGGLPTWWLCLFELHLQYSSVTASRTLSVYCRSTMLHLPTNKYSNNPTVYNSQQLGSGDAWLFNKRVTRKGSGLLGKSNPVVTANRFNHVTASTMFH